MTTSAINPDLALTAALGLAEPVPAAPVLLPRTQELNPAAPIHQNLMLEMPSFADENSIFGPVHNDVSRLLERQEQLALVLEPLVGRSYLPPLHNAWKIYEEKDDLEPFFDVISRLRMFAIKLWRAAYLADLLALSDKPLPGYAKALQDGTLADVAARRAFEDQVDADWRLHLHYMRESGGREDIGPCDLEF